MKLKFIYLFMLFLALLHLVLAQTVQPAVSETDNPPGATEIYQALLRLKVAGSALYIAAHPDDENTRVLAWLSRGEKIRSGYLSLTRGDGGQNLLGRETGSLLGVLRTQELMGARKVDGAMQFFTRAIDFGYSKTADETFGKWDQEAVLRDMVRIIRTFRPDILITRFSRGRGGHGHHIASAILAEQAFYASGDPDRFPEQLVDLAPWKPLRLVWDAWQADSHSVIIDAGSYDGLAGESYEEMAARSRSMHKSQGFGSSPRRGTRENQFIIVCGDPPLNSLFDRIDLSLDRFWPEGNGTARIDQIISGYNPQKPYLLLPQLEALKSDISALSKGHWRDIKLDEIDQLIVMCSGLWLESSALQPVLVPGETMSVAVRCINRFGLDVVLNEIKLEPNLSADTLINQRLDKNIPFEIQFNKKTTVHTNYTVPYWLEKENNGAMFVIDNPDNVLRPENPPAAWTRCRLTINGHALEVILPVEFRWTDPIRGERKKPLSILPPVNVSFESYIHVFQKNQSREVSVVLNAVNNSISGYLSLQLPDGWVADPSEISFQVDPGTTLRKKFLVKPERDARDGNGTLLARIDGKSYRWQIREINYDHIIPQSLVLPATSLFIKLDMEVPVKQIGYIMGSGDQIPETLTQLGYEVTLLSDEDLEKSDLSRFGAIICGVRAYNAREALVYLQDRLNAYVREGGTWIVQHNTRFGNHVEQIGPLPFSTNGRDRIAEEDAPIQILDPQHPLMNYPNKITPDDFAGWIQERGLYFADTWDQRFTPLLSGHDRGEDPKKGGLLYAEYGKGVFIFTGYAWFRQLPAGVPGAYRLFVNMISARGKGNQ